MLSLTYLASKQAPRLVVHGTRTYDKRHEVCDCLHEECDRLPWKFSLSTTYMTKVVTHPIYTVTDYRTMKHIASSLNHKRTFPWLRRPCTIFHCHDQQGIYIHTHTLLQSSTNDAINSRDTEHVHVLRHSPWNEMKWVQNITTPNHPCSSRVVLSCQQWCFRYNTKTLDKTNPPYPPSKFLGKKTKHTFRSLRLLHIIQQTYSK